MDDLLIFSPDEETHRKRTRCVLQHMTELDLHLKLEKCCFATTEVEYLGMIIKPGQLAMDPIKLDGIASCYDCFFSSIHASPFSLTSPCRSSLLLEGGIPTFVLLSSRTPISTDRFSCTDYVVPLTHHFYRLLSHSTMTRPSD